MFVDEFVEIRIRGNNKDHYKNLGYQFKMGDYIKVKVSDLQRRCTAKVKFICDICNGENQITEESKYKPFWEFKGNPLHACKHKDCIKTKKITENEYREVPLEKSFGYNYPNLIKHWHPTKNKKGPYEYRCSTADKIYWVCDKCNNEFRTTLNDVTSKGSWCPYCQGKRVYYGNSLEFLRPDIAKRWHPQKNGNITPSMITYGSHKKFWWKCPNGYDSHDFIAAVIELTGNKNIACPYCSGKRVDPEMSFGALQHILLDEWDYNKNTINPYEVMPNSNKKVWWKCSKCSYEWFAGINKRTYGRGCPSCAKSGYSLSKPANLYVVRWYNKDFEFLKIGITNNSVKSRIGQQKRNTNYNADIIKVFHFNDGLKCYNMEKLIKNKFCTGVIDKELFGDGFTETTDIKNLDSILQLIESNM